MSGGGPVAPLSPPPHIYASGGNQGSSGSHMACGPHVEHLCSRQYVTKDGGTGRDGGYSLSTFWKYNNKNATF